MRCPKCQFDNELQTTDCLKCGINFARYQAALAAKEGEPGGVSGPGGATAAAIPAPIPDGIGNAASLMANTTPMAMAPTTGPSELAAARAEARRELMYRAFALPLALLAARLAANTGFRMAEGMLAMVLHESGHAITAWLTGRWAVPMLWVTMRGDNRNWWIVLFVTAAIGFGGFVAWKLERWGWVCAAGAALALQLIFAIQPAFTQGALIVFGGDGGAMVLATILMATFYAPRESALYKSLGLRWGLLAVGALSFMHVYVLWTGPFENIPFGEIEGVNLSDPSLLTQMYGWPVPQLIERYVRLGNVCLATLAGLYVWGLVSALLEIRASPGPEKQGAWG